MKRLQGSEVVSPAVRDSRGWRMGGYVVVGGWWVRWDEGGVVDVAPGD